MSTAVHKRKAEAANKVVKAAGADAVAAKSVSGCVVAKVQGAQRRKSSGSYGDYAGKMVMMTNGRQGKFVTMKEVREERRT